jgi:NitT/TauT family transport system substrate-binding protein
VETFRNLFYTPIYVAVAGGFLYAEGLNVQFSTVPDGHSAIEVLRSGAADIAQTGVSRTLMELDAGRDDAPLHIAEINQRDGFFLLGHSSVVDWGWGNLENATLIPVGFTPVPWMPLRTALLKNGVGLESVTLIEGLSADGAIDRFLEGGADYIQLPHPQAQMLIEDGSAHLVTAIGPELGYLCYSSFAAAPSYLDSRPDIVQRFVDGFGNALRWLSRTDVETVARRVAPFFPDLPEGLLRAAIDQYRDQATWPKDPTIGEDGFTNMRDMLIDGGLVTGSHAYDRVVRPEFAIHARGG